MKALLPSPRTRRSPALVVVTLGGSSPFCTLAASTGSVGLIPLNAFVSMATGAAEFSDAFALGLELPTTSVQATSWVAVRFIPSYASVHPLGQVTIADELVLIKLTKTSPETTPGGISVPGVALLLEANVVAKPTTSGALEPTVGPNTPLNPRLWKVEIDETAPADGDSISWGTCVAASATSARSPAEARRPLTIRCGDTRRRRRIRPKPVRPGIHAPYRLLSSSRGARTNRNIPGTRFGGPADSASPVALRPFLTEGLPLSSA
jgi:hypothetical protein